MPLTRLLNSALDGGAKAIGETRPRSSATPARTSSATAPRARKRSPNGNAKPSIPFSTGRKSCWGRASSSPLVSSMSPSRPKRSPPSAKRSKAMTTRFALAALSVITTFSPAPRCWRFAVARGRLTAAEAWRIAHVDEDFQIEKWGEDAEATARRAARWREMAAAASVLA